MRSLYYSTRKLHRLGSGLLMRGGQGRAQARRREALTAPVSPGTHNGSGSRTVAAPCELGASGARGNVTAPWQAASTAN